MATDVEHKLPPGMCGQLVGRSSLVRQGLHLIPQVLTKKEKQSLSFCLENRGEHSVRFKKGQRVANIVLTRTMTPPVRRVKKCTGQHDADTKRELLQGSEGRKEEETEQGACKGEVVRIECTQDVAREFLPEQVGEKIVFRFGKSVVIGAFSTRAFVLPYKCTRQKTGPDLRPVDCLQGKVVVHVKIRVDGTIGVVLRNWGERPTMVTSKAKLFWLAGRLELAKEGQICNSQVGTYLKEGQKEESKTSQLTREAIQQQYPGLSNAKSWDIPENRELMVTMQEIEWIRPIVWSSDCKHQPISLVERNQTLQVLDDLEKNGVIERMKVGEEATSLKPW